MNEIKIVPVSNGFLITVTVTKEGESAKTMQIVAESMEKCITQVKNAVHKIRP